MTRPTFRLGAVPIALLVVLSVVAGGVTFSGSVTAVDGVTDPYPFTPQSVGEETTNDHSFNYSFTGVNTSGNTTLTLGVDSDLTIDDDNIVVRNATGSELDATRTDSGDELAFEVNSTTSTVYFNGTVTLTAPSVSSDRDYDVTFTGEDDDSDSSTETVALTVADFSVSTQTFDPAEVDQETENEHTLNYSITGINTSDNTKFSLTVPSEFDIGTYDIEVKDADGTVLDDSPSESGNTLTMSANPSTETAYLAGSINLTSPAVPEGQEEETYPFTAEASDTNGRSDSVDEDITVRYVGGVAGAPEFESAVQYVPSPGSPQIEVAFSEDIENFEDNYGLYVDDEEVTSDVVASTVVGSASEAQGRAIIELDDVDSRELTLRLDDGIEDADGNPLDNPGDKDVTFAPTTVRADGDTNAYRGSTVSIVASATDTSVTLQGTDDDTDSYFFEGSTGTNSRIFLFDTTDEELGDYEADIEAEGTASITLRNLDLSLSVEDRNVTTLQTIEGTVSAQTSDREIYLELLDDDGDIVDDRYETLGGQGEYDFTYDLESLAVETGEYTIRATDTTTGISVESDVIDVTEAGDTRADLPNDVVQEHRGDVAAIPIQLENTREATLTIGDDEAGYEASVTVRDGGGDDRDGRVTVYFNSYEASEFGTGEFDGENDLFSVSDDDEVVDGEVTIGVSDLLDAEAYPLSVETAGRETDVQLLVLEERATTDIRTLTAPRNRYNNLDAPEDVHEGTGEWVTEDSEIAFGDVVVYEIEASGLEGALDARGEDTVTEAFFDFANGTASDPAALFSVEQRDPGPNQDPLLLELNRSNARVVADSANDTYYVAFRTDDSDIDGVQDADGDGVIDGSENERGSIDAEDDLRASFTVYGEDENDLDLTASGDDETVETTHSLTAPEFEMTEPFNVTEVSGQEIFGEATVAPGTEVNVRVRSDDGVRPAFLKTASTTVDADGQFLVTLSFNDTRPGDSYTVTVDDIGPAPELAVDGTVQAVIPTATTETPAETTTTTTSTTTATSTDAPTTASTTTTAFPTVQTPTTTPGFGVLAALVALAGAALLALRRD
ncbi:DUF7827 domain-containing protein [Halobellus sp. GM3]|uniref:DUF7827 domain-containing protein n=1 Tax=Halobellus sp. GM3 TaxID=3458410 RepID=UPI00403DE63E